MALFTKLGRWMSHRRGIITGPSDMSVVFPGKGRMVDHDTALKITAFYAGIRLISENIAALPKAVRRYTADGPVNAADNGILSLINIRPNAYTNAFDFWNVMSTWLEGWGNAYALIRRGIDGRPSDLHQIHPSFVQVTLVEGKKMYKVRGTGKDWLDGIHRDEDMLHFMLVTLDGLTGIDPVLYNALALGKSKATEDFGAEFYEKGGNIRAVMETDGEMGDEDYERFMAHFKASSSNYETPLLEYGIKYKQLSVNPVAAQLVQSETMSLQDIARILNIPPHMIGELSHATFSNIEHQTIQFVQYTLRPIVKRFEVEMESKLFLGREVGQFDIKFILDGLLRGDTTARSAFYHNAILDGYMSRNEVRELEGLQHRDGLDDMLFPLNSGIVGADGRVRDENKQNDD